MSLKIEYVGQAYILAHNKLTMNSGFDEELLKLELEALSNDFDFDLSLTGFNEEELEDLELMLNDDTQHETNQDEADEVPDIDDTKIVIKQGDLIELDNHRLMCGDSTDITKVEKLVGGGNG